MKKESLIISCIIGDGYIAKESKASSYYLSIQHSTKQKDFLLYKKSLFESLGYKTNLYELKQTDKRKYPAIRLNVKDFNKDILINLRRSFYPNGNKTITRHLLNYLDPMGLAIWWMDDGCLSIYKRKDRNSTARYGKLCTHCFTYDENVIIKNYLETVWKIKTTVKVEKNKYYYIYLSPTGLNQLFSIISPFIIPSMNYKIDMKYK
jgi:recombination protein RecA